MLVSPEQDSQVNSQVEELKTDQRRAMRGAAGSREGRGGCREMKPQHADGCLRDPEQG